MTTLNSKIIYYNSLLLRDGAIFMPWRRQHMNTFTYNNVSSHSFHCLVSGEDTFEKPAPDMERIQVPGETGNSSSRESGSLTWISLITV